MLPPTVLEDADEERVVTLNAPPGGRWVVLWLGQIKTKRPEASGMEYVCVCVCVCGGGGGGGGGRGGKEGEGGESNEKFLM